MSVSSLRASRLWCSAFDKRDELAIYSEARERLKVSLLIFRDRAEQLVAQIPRDLRDFTVHDVSHLDALWEYADLIAGPEYKINPVEAFVLGGAFLIHDAGMSLAAYPGGYKEIRKHRRWSDTLFSIQQDLFNRPPTVTEVARPSSNARKMTVEALLRELHAEQAEKLISVQWGLGSKRYYLIDDPDLRETLGPLIGKIGLSHWWSPSKVASEFDSPRGAPLSFRHWHVDALRLACLLRLADAAHLDWRRAPGFLRALVAPVGVAADHWNFQEHLNQPILEGERLLYTANKPFCRTETQSWWLCYDSLRLVDQEMRAVDEIFVERRTSRFAARGVKGIADPARLTKFIPTKDWFPVDARIKVSDVAGLVRRMGGEQLYGNNPNVALRELIQNASDAVRARRALEEREEDWGEILVSRGQDETGPWIEVRDTGIGMSENVLTGSLLDFGAPFWGSRVMLSELPGLAASGFKSTGRYGIGFFSVFMLGQRIRVSTLRAGEAERETRVLEFDAGTQVQPVLRRAEPAEQVRGGGTAVRVWLKKQSDPQGSRAVRIPDIKVRGKHDTEWCEYPGMYHMVTFVKLVRLLCPSLDVKIRVKEGDEEVIVSQRGQWLEDKGKSFFGRLQPGVVQDDTIKLTSNLRTLHLSDGSVAGRACIAPFEDERNGVVSVGGLRATDLKGIAGIMFGRPLTVTRNIAEIIVPSAELARWATEQSMLVTKLWDSPLDLATCAGFIRICGGDATRLPLVLVGRKWLSAYALAKTKNLPGEMILIDNAELARANPQDKQLRLRDNVLMTVAFRWRSIYRNEEQYLSENRTVGEYFDPIENLVYVALSFAWNRGITMTTVGNPFEVAPGTYCNGTLFRRHPFLEIEDPEVLKEASSFGFV